MTKVIMLATFRLLATSRNSTTVFKKTLRDFLVVSYNSPIFLSTNVRMITVPAASYARYNHLLWCHQKKVMHTLG